MAIAENPLCQHRRQLATNRFRNCANHSQEALTGAAEFLDSEKSRRLPRMSRSIAPLKVPEKKSPSPPEKDWRARSRSA